MTNWFDIHLSPEKAKTLTRDQYYAARSWLRKVRRNIRRRYAAAYVDPNNPNTVIVPAVPMEGN